MSVIPEAVVGGYPWFDRPFDRLTVLSDVEGLTTLSEVEGESGVHISLFSFFPYAPCTMPKKKRKKTRAYLFLYSQVYFG